MTEPATYNYPRYLQSKTSVDARALNRNVWADFLEHLTGPSMLRIMEVGGGIGATVQRIVQGLKERPCETLHYTFVDVTPENIDTAVSSLRTWAQERGYEVSGHTEQTWTHRDLEVRLRFLTVDLMDIQTEYDGPSVDALVGQAVLDLLPIEEALRALQSVLRDGGLWYLPLHYDGVTAFEPSFHPTLDENIERLYHESMSDAEQEGGREGAVSGRRLLSYFQSRDRQIVAAGGSDWVVTPRNGTYSEDEAYFLYHILHFVEQELLGHPELDDASFRQWIDTRRRQVERGELIYIAHQLDILARDLVS